MKVTTKCGTVIGKQEAEYLVFKGIPYAKADRFMPPRPYTWDGELSCTEFGKKAIQNNAPWFPGAEEEPWENFSEDCLSLNIYTPSLKARLPVLIEIHGGAFQNGSNQERTPGQIFDRPEAVYVAINYRLGALGYLYLGEELGPDYQNTGNNGLLDQSAALLWIYENIEAFGGDSSRVTLMGSSAGAKSVGALMLIPACRPYFNQAILSSGAMQSIRSQTTAAQLTKRFLAAGLVTAEALLTMPAEDLLKIQIEFCKSPGNTCFFGPVADGITIPSDWYPKALAGDLWQGRAMLGSSRNELIFYKWMDPDFLKHAPAIAADLFGDNAAIAINHYEAFINTENPPEDEACKDYWVKILSDYMYRMYTQSFAELLAAQGNSVWSYSTEYQPAMHCMDQTLAFGNLEDPMLFPDPSTLPERTALGQKIRSAFTRFIKTGDPSDAALTWSPLEPTAPAQMLFDRQCQLKEIPGDDTLSDFPESVLTLH